MTIPGRPYTAVWDHNMNAVKVFYEPGRTCELALVAEYATPPEGLRPLASVSGPHWTFTTSPVSVNGIPLQQANTQVATTYHVYWKQNR